MLFKKEEFSAYIYWFILTAIAIFKSQCFKYCARHGDAHF